MHPVATLLAGWYASHKRQLPWRDTRDAYRIWVSEIILQQTRVEQGLPYYQDFLSAFPTVEALAAAPLDEVFKLWQGLGYYARARHMHEAAQTVVSVWHGRFPRTPEQLRTIPGIGPYTAAAVASFAFGVPVPVVDGNVCRVVARCAGQTEPVDTATGRRMLETTVGQWIEGAPSDVFNQAIMDFGALQCVPQSPDCADCVLAPQCLACKAGLVHELPRKSSRPKVRDRYFNYLVISTGPDVYLQQRTGRDIWCGLYEFPLLETPSETAACRLADTESWRTWFAGTLPVVASREDTCVHCLTHQRLHVRFVRVQVDEMPAAPPAWKRVSWDHLERYAVPRVIDRWLRNPARQGAI